jgi:tRNA threonylcarbamoyladenosine biosynthesis protein TsaE
LYGDLGAGKTCLTKGIAQGLGINDEEYVRSSTFVLLNEYKGGRIPLYHFDFFRLEREDEILGIGFDEFLHAGGITVIEWADKFPEILSKPRLDIEILIVDLNTRKIIFSFFHSEKRFALLKK